MAKKSKSLNPADAFRKAQRQKEIKRNKLDRKKARQGAQTKKDSIAIEAEIRQLEHLQKPTPSEQNRLKDLKHELSLILKAKADQPGATVRFGDSSSSKVIIDPATGLPSTSTATTHANGNGAGSSGKTAGRTTVPSGRLDSRTMDWFGPDGKLLEPEKSYYYDPVFNPFGVPPPGMPMRMKPSVESLAEPSMSAAEVPPAAEHDVAEGCTLVGAPIEGSVNAESDAERLIDGEEHSEEEDSESADDEEDGEDDIPLPEGSPPPRAGSEEGSSDDIPLPEGPPPPKPVPVSCAPQLVNRPARPADPSLNPTYPSCPPFMHPPPPFFPPPITLAPGGPPPPMIAGMGMLPFPLGPNGFPLPPPPMNIFQPLPFAPPSANLPAKPTILSAPTPAAPPKPAPQTSATVTALPQLRDLKREATSFVPAAIRKKRKELDRRAGLAGLGNSHRIQAAPEAFADGSAGPDASQHLPSATSAAPRPAATSLLSALKRDGVVLESPVGKGNPTIGGPEKDDYEKFVESLGDVL